MHQPAHPRTLTDLLDRHQHLAAEYHGNLSNHLPMLLHALHCLGADAARLQAYAAGYLKRYEGVTAPRVGTPLSHWQAHRGDFSCHADLQATFAAAIASQGATATVQQVVADLWPGVAAAAFHGLIRTAHALQSGHAGELAAGLAYWAARWQPVPVQESPGPGTLPFRAWSAALESHIGQPRPAGRVISDRIASVGQTSECQQLAGQLQTGPQTLAELAGFAIDHYARSGNFTLLHMVTGCRAARVVLGVAPASAGVALRELVPAFTAAFLASGIRHDAVDSQEEPLKVTWSEVVARAISSDDDHVAKLVHACREEEAIYGGPLYLWAAHRATCPAAA